MSNSAGRKEARNETGTEYSTKQASGIFTQELKHGKGTYSLGGLFRPGKFLVPLLSILIGGAGGFIYYYFVGCKSGTCPITSNPFGSIIAGGILGFLLFGSMSPASKNSDNEKNK
ncbi:MAG: DUF6132 family protein [Bacteroidales bacterium]|jgi:hypothetical protein|nr:DUF6132 family protein [Bacteroidales bacterium]